METWIRNTLFDQISSRGILFIYKIFIPVINLVKIFNNLWIRYEEEFEDTKGVGQKKKYKRTNNDLQNITHKTKDGVTRAPLKSLV
jgi:hypothetical protein